MKQDVNLSFNQSIIYNTFKAFKKYLNGEWLLSSQAHNMQHSRREVAAFALWSLFLKVWGCLLAAFQECRCNTDSKWKFVFIFYEVGCCALALFKNSTQGHCKKCSEALRVVCVFHGGTKGEGDTHNICRPLSTHSLLIVKRIAHCQMNVQRGADLKCVMCEFLRLAVAKRARGALLSASSVQKETRSWWPLGIKTEDNSSF